MKIARVFPRKTRATPVDELAFYDEPGMFLPDIDAVHVSVAFSWDLRRAEVLAKSWERIGVPVQIGGPATGEAGRLFTPGLYLRPGYVITSRGCPNRCWFCSVWRREGQAVRELPITAGWNVLDDNLLACSAAHVRQVFDMLIWQKVEGRAIEFTGGLEAARLLPWHVEYLSRLKPASLFFAYDTTDDLDPLAVAAQMLHEAGFTAGSHRLRCYVLCGYAGDSFDQAEARMRQVLALEMLPMAMLYRDDTGRRDPGWIRFAKCWTRPASVHAMHRDGTRAQMGGMLCHV